MKLIKKSRLLFQQEKSDRVYEVDLCELASRKDQRFIVNFRYGRRGGTLREGTKTKDPVTLDEAEKLFTSVVISKTNKGYRDTETPEPDPADNPADDTLQDHARLQALLAALVKEQDSKRRTRIIWNLGDSDVEENDRAALSAELVKYINRGHWLEDYAIARALARLEAKAHLDVLLRLQQAKQEPLRAVALEARLLLSTDTGRAELLGQKLALLPPDLQQTLQTEDAAAIALELSACFAADSLNRNQLLKTCYQVSLICPALHRALLLQLEQCPLVPGVFQGIRYLFKIAELRLDGAMFGLLTRRFETTSPYFRNNWGWAYIPGEGGMKTASELKKSDSRLAYSHKTRDYFRRRSWRSLKRLGRAGNSRYVDMATAMLLAVEDRHAVEAKRSSVYRWQQEEGRWQQRLVSSSEFGRFANFLAFNHILYENSPQFSLAPSGRAWISTGETFTGRGECFPALWDKKPEAALTLLKASLCAEVHDFALRLLADHPGYCETIASGSIAALLQSAYAQTADFALELAKKRFTQGNVAEADLFPLLLALINSDLTAARQYGLEMLQARPALLADIELAAHLLLVPHADAHEYLLSAAPDLNYDKAGQMTLLQRLLDLLFKGSAALNPTPLSEAQALNIAQFCALAAAQGVEQCPLTQIERLLAADNTAWQLLGAHLLRGNAIGFAEIPQRLYQHIYQSPSEAVRGAGIALLGKQSDAELLRQLDGLVAQLAQGQAAERAALLDLFRRLAANNSDYCGEIFQALLPLMFRAEQQEGLHTELLSLFDETLDPAGRALDKATVWRLLLAQSSGAQRLGALLLRKGGKPSQINYSVRQWAQLAHHADVSVRGYAFDAFENHIDRVKAHTRDALRILDAPWEESREFGFRFFTEHYSDTDWSPETIVGICDNPREAVQAYGRELIQRFFHRQQGVEYLMRLSQHPSGNVQLFVSNFLDDYATGNAGRIAQLEQYFLTVLSQVNRGRICKDRVLAFLEREANASRQVAELVARLFTRLSLTVVHKDKAGLIKAMLNLQKHYPDVSLPINVESTKRKALRLPESTQETAHGI